MLRNKSTSRAPAEVMLVTADGEKQLAIRTQTQDKI